MTCENTESLWEDYYLICDLLGKDSSQAQSMFEYVWQAEEDFIRESMSKVWNKAIKSAVRKKDK